jgi:hypothetical protein
MGGAWCVGSGVEGQAAAARRFQPGQQAQQGALAAAAAAHQCDELARRHAQVDVVQHLAFAVGLGHAAQCDRQPGRVGAHGAAFDHLAVVGRRAVSPPGAPEPALQGQLLTHRIAFVQAGVAGLW